MLRFVRLCFSIVLLLLNCSCSKDNDSEPANIRILSDKILNFDSDGGSSNLMFETNKTWNIISSSDWCQVSKQSGLAGHVEISMICKPNDSEIQRECSITIFAEDIYEAISVSQEPRAPEPISSRIYGSWVIKSGKISGFLLPAKFSQTIEFTKDGNFKEEAYSGYDASSSPEVYWTSETCFGSWNGADNRIVLRNWESEALPDPLIVQSITDDELILLYKDNELKYVRKSDEFISLSAEIIGEWHSITTEPDVNKYIFFDNNKGYYIINKFYRSNFDWWVENSNEIVTHDEKAASSYVITYPINFVNSKYLGLDTRALVKQ